MDPISIIMMDPVPMAWQVASGAGAFLAFLGFGHVVDWFESQFRRQWAIDQMPLNIPVMAPPPPPPLPGGHGMAYRRGG